MNKVLVAALVVLGGALTMAFACLFTSVLVWFLWNNVVPDLFHGPTITFFQAFCLNWLCGILFQTTVKSKDD